MEKMVQRKKRSNVYFNKHEKYGEKGNWRIEQHLEVFLDFCDLLCMGRSLPVWRLWGVRFWRLVWQFGRRFLQRGWDLHVFFSKLQNSCRSSRRFTSSSKRPVISLKSWNWSEVSKSVASSQWSFIDKVSKCGVFGVFKMHRGPWSKMVQHSKADHLISTSNSPPMKMEWPAKSTILWNAWHCMTMYQQHCAGWATVLNLMPF